MSHKQIAPLFRVQFNEDPDAQFEECNGESRPLTAEEYKENTYLKACPHCGGTGRTNDLACPECGGKKRIDVPYDEYLEYYGNPERHVYLQCSVEKKCPCCGVWSYVGGTGNIDFMDDNSELRHIGAWFTPESIVDPLNAEALGYLREVAIEDLEEAGWKAPKHLDCAKRGCKYHHTTGSRFCAQHGGEGA